MKKEAISQMRRKLQSDTPVFGLRITLNTAAVADIAAGLGFDWICIDVPSGPLDWQDAREHVRATARSQTVALVRLADASPEQIAYAQALGADGVLIPCPKQTIELQALPVRFGAGDAEAGGQAQFIIAPVIRDSCTTQDLSSLAAIEGLDFFMIDRIIDGAKESIDFVHIVSSLRDAGKQAGVFALDRGGVHRFLDLQFRVIGVGSDVSIVQTEIQTMLKSMNLGRAPA